MHDSRALLLKVDRFQLFTSVTSPISILIRPNEGSAGPISTLETREAIIFFYFCIGIFQICELIESESVLIPVGRKCLQ